MAAGGAAKAKTPIEVTEKMALNYVREAITNFHPKAGPMNFSSPQISVLPLSLTSFASCFFERVKAAATVE
jgi:hypothetical protein